MNCQVSEPLVDTRFSSWTSSERPVPLFVNNGTRCTRVSYWLCHVLQRVECIQTKTSSQRAARRFQAARRAFPRQRHFHQHPDVSKVAALTREKEEVGARRYRGNRTDGIEIIMWKVACARAARLAFSEIIDYPGLCNKHAEKCAPGNNAWWKSSVFQGTRVYTNVRPLGMHKMYTIYFLIFTL